MTFSPDADYWARKLDNIRRAIEGTKATLEGLTEQRQIDAHQAQLESYERSYAVTWQKYCNWANKRDNIARGARY